jgi:hypothetical protein
LRLRQPVLRLHPQRDRDGECEQASDNNTIRPERVYAGIS